MKMNKIISDYFYYYNKGFLSNEWKKIRFELYSNGCLARVNSEGVVEKKIDLKKAYSTIKIKSASEFILQKTNEKKNLSSIIQQFPEFTTDSKLMIIPNRTGNKWVLLFVNADMLNEWMVHIKKWANVPKIKIDQYNENEDQSSIEVFKELKQNDLCKKFSIKNHVFAHLRHDFQKNSLSTDTVSTADKNEKNRCKKLPKSTSDSECKMLGVY